MLSIPWEGSVTSHAVLLVPFQLVSLSFQAPLYFQSNIKCNFIHECKAGRMLGTWLAMLELQVNASSAVALEGEVARLIRVSRSVMNEL